MYKKIDVTKRELNHLVDMIYRHPNYYIQKCDVIDRLIAKKLAEYKTIPIPLRPGMEKRIFITGKGKQALLENRPWVLSAIETNGNFCKSSSNKTQGLRRLYEELKANTLQ